MPDPSAIDNAIVATLLADATLMGILTDGVFIDQANPGARQFAIVSLITSFDEPMFQGCAYEDALYLVKAVVLVSSGADVKAAAARIHTVLEGASLTITGYAHSLLRRVERVRYTEVDDVDRTIRWQHRGGRYQVIASPTS